MVGIRTHLLAKSDAEDLQESATHRSRKICVRLDAIDKDDPLSRLRKTVDEERNAVHLAHLDYFHGGADGSTHPLLRDPLRSKHRQLTLGSRSSV